MYTATTVINPSRIDGVDYNCTILGNGKRNHFGIDFPDFDPATIEFKCDNLTGKAAVNGDVMGGRSHLIGTLEQ
jgi:hypothetical protein